MTRISPEIINFHPEFGNLKGRKIIANFNGGRITSDAGIMWIAELDKKLKITARFAEGFQDNRNLSYVDYSGASHFGKKRKLIRERQSRIMSRLRYLLVPSRKKYLVNYF